MSEKMSYPSKVYLLGAGGIGMSALGMFFMNRGVTVAGYDRTQGITTEMLKDKGAEIIFADSPELIPSVFSGSKDDVWVVYTPAVPRDLKLFSWFKQKKYIIYKRAEVLGIITRDFITFAVAGTHGKTTTTAAISHILRNSGVDCTSFVGGISKNTGTNFLNGKSNIAVVEADEYDRSFHFLNPDYAVVTSVEPDHLDIYGSYDMVRESFMTFVSKLKNGGKLVVHKNYSGIFNRTGPSTVTYGAGTDAVYSADKIKCGPDGITFDLIFPEKKAKTVTVPVYGQHNAENVLAAGAATHLFGIGPDNICNALSSFTGVRRRFDIIYNAGNKILVDDYAHHPDELDALTKTLKQHFPGKKYAAIFQPHLYSRTRDFAERFAASLSEFHNVFLFDIYPAREEPIEGVDSKMLLKSISSPFKKCVTPENVLTALGNISFDILVTIGAGNVDDMLPELKKWMKLKYECKS